VTVVVTFAVVVFCGCDAVVVLLAALVSLAALALLVALLALVVVVFADLVVAVSLLSACDAAVDTAC